MKHRYWRGKEIDKMSESELRVHLNEAITLYEEAAGRHKQAEDALECHRANLKTTRIVQKSQRATMEVLEKAARCMHENLRSDSYDEVTVYNCLDCGFGWGD